MLSTSFLAVMVALRWNRVSMPVSQAYFTISWSLCDYAFNGRYSTLRAIKREHFEF